MSHLFPPIPDETPPLPTRWKVNVDPRPAVIMDAQAVAPPRHPVGLNVRQDVNYADVLDCIKLLGGVRSSLFHLDVGSLPRLHDFKAHVDILIWRPREFTSERLHEMIGPEAYIDWARDQLRVKGFKPGEVWIHLHNESVWSDTVIEWERRAAIHALANGEQVILLNQAVGNPHETQVHMARPLLKLAGERPDSIILGLHEYMSVWGNRTYPYYLGRWQHTYLEADGTPSKTKHSFESYRHSVKELKAKPVRYLVTEWGADHLSDDEAYTNTLPKTRGEISGVHTLSAVWQRDYDKPINPVKRPYPGLDTAFFEQLRVAWETGQYDNPEMEAALIYGWGKEWPLFDISGMSKLHELLATWRPKPMNPVPEVVDFNLPYSAVLIEGTNLRTTPTTDNRNSKVIATVKADTLVTVREPVEPKEADGYTWFKVRADVPLIAGTVEGWMAKHRPDLFKKVADGEEEPAPPKPDEEPDTTDPDDIPPPSPAATKDDIDKLRAEMMAYQSEAIGLLLGRIVELEQALRNVVGEYGKGHVAALESVKQYPKSA